MKGDRLFTALAALVAFALVHAAVATFDVPGLLYDPVRRVFSFGHHGPGLMGYYGEALWAALGAVGTAIAAAVATRGRTVSARAISFVSGLAIGAVVLEFVAIALVSARGL